MPRVGAPLTGAAGTDLGRRSGGAEFLDFARAEGLAMGAVAADLGACDQDLKAEMALDLFAQALQGFAEELFDAAAAQADDVSMLLFEAGFVVMLVAAVVHQVELIHQAAQLQHLQGAVDRDAVDFGVTLLGHAIELLDIQVRAGAVDQFEQNLPLSSEANPTFLQRAFGRIQRHGGTLQFYQERAGEGWGASGNGRKRGLLARTWRVEAGACHRIGDSGDGAVFSAGERSACPLLIQFLSAMFRKVLIANRGEIAVRVMRTLREMGIPSVAIYSDADRTSLHVRMADEAEPVGAAPSAESYLRGDRILEAARRHGADAIHPGYGFLSENAGFAAACEDAGIAFIGPSAHSIRAMGSKTAARQTAIAAGAPVVPGTDHAVNLQEAQEFGREHGYPILLKAVAGGGGKGMRSVAAESELESAFRNAASEAERSFNNAEIYIEKLIEQPRHIEIQLIGDRHGNMVHLGERECSIQRRHQKVMEECPSPLVALHPSMREEMGEAAIRAARAANYYNAGTVEFLVDRNRRFYFLEMNTRLQVEHPVTELVTGLDLVRLQIEIAAGGLLPFTQSDIGWRGWAIECRVYAEDPFHDFLPYPGKLTRLTRPLGPGVRLDGCVYDGWTVPMEYDPLLAKLAVWAGTREEAIERLVRALREYDVGGIRTNIGFFRQILEDGEFRAANLHTGFIEEFFTRHRPPEAPPELAAAAALAAALHTRSRRAAGPQHGAAASAWLAEGRGDRLR